LTVYKKDTARRKETIKPWVS